MCIDCGCQDFIVYDLLAVVRHRSIFCLLYRVVKEEITDEESGLPCVNGRVVAWVCMPLYCFRISRIQCFIKQQSSEYFTGL